VASYGALLLATAGALIARFLRIVVAPKIEVIYVNGPKLKASTGPTLLEISLLNAVPHANSCGGRGRCTACSVRIEQGEDTLPPRTAAEIELLGGQDERIRLACQITPTAALTVTRLTPTADTASDAGAEPELDTAGIERQVAAFSVHLQGHATLVGSRRAYDAIFFLNEFLEVVSACIVKHNGTVMQTTGRGIVAVFDQAESVQAACRAAFAAAADIDVALDRLNERFSAEFGRPIAVAMGLAFGPAYLGRIGAGPSKPFTAVGPVIDAAEDLAGFAESRKCQLASTSAVLHAARIDSNGMELVPFTAATGDSYDAFTINRARLTTFA
jgi:adenylate cyclase